MRRDRTAGPARTSSPTPEEEKESAAAEVKKECASCDSAVRAEYSPSGWFCLVKEKEVDGDGACRRYAPRRDREPPGGGRKDESENE